MWEQEPHFDEFCSTKSMATRKRETSYIIHDIRRTFRDDFPDRSNTAFYWAVQAGNVRVVEDVLASMHEQYMRAELRWLLNTSSEHVRRRCTWRKFICIPLQLLLLLLTFLVALTPAFRIYHGIVSRIVFFKKPTESDLPLLLAALSGRQQMVDLFLREGVTLQQTDSQGRNVFHALVDHSRTCSDAAVIYKLIVLAFGNNGDAFRRALLKQTDRSGLTALEACARDGSPQLLNAFFNTESVLRQTAVDVTSDHFEVVGRNERAWSGNLRPTVEDPDAKDKTDAYQRIRYNVTDYEQGGLLGRQSLPLFLVTACRRLSDYGADDLIQLCENLFISTWYALKQSALFPCFLADFVLRGLIYVSSTLFMSEVEVEFLALPFVTQYRSVLQQIEEQRLLNDSYAGSTVAEVCNGTTTYVGFPFNDCQAEALRALQASCQGVNLTAMLGALEMEEYKDLWRLSRPKGVLPSFLIVVSSCYILLSTLVKVVFVAQACRCKTLGGALRHIFALDLPGSALDELLLLVVCTTHIFLSMLITLITSHEVLDDQLETLAQRANATFCVYMMFNFLSVISTLRLVPYIGYYILVAKKLLIVLVQFMVMCGFVIVALALALEYVMRSPECPLVAKPEFATIADSLYETYKLTFLAGNFHYDLNTSSKLLYMFYSMYGVLLLLNLIIAMMSCSTDVLMSEPWKRHIWRQEFMHHYLYLEVGSNIVTWLLRANRKVLKSAGYSVNGKGKNLQIFVEVVKRVEIGQLKAAEFASEESSYF